MDIEKAKELKSGLQEKIFELVKYFEDETGCEVTMIDVQRLKEMSGRSKVAWVNIIVEF